MLFRVWLIAVALLLVGCSGPRLPFEKEQPLLGPQAEMVRPPWEALVQAGPGADKEIDLETLNGPLAQPMPSPAAPVVDPSLAETDVVEPTPTPAKAGKGAVAIKSVYVDPVEGGKVAGGAELTEAMRQVLRDAGWTVVKTQRPDALTIRGKVKILAAKGANQTVKLVWVVGAPDGKRLGDIAQSNDVPKGSLDQGWGENARFATEAAAEGIFKLIQSYR